MLTWARLEGLTIEPPEFDDQAPPAHDFATIEAGRPDHRAGVWIAVSADSG
jgi:hypothetical protein